MKQRLSAQLLEPEAFFLQTLEVNSGCARFQPGPAERGKAAPAGHQMSEIECRQTVGQI